MENQFSKVWLDEKHLKIERDMFGNAMINPLLASKILNSVRKIVNIVHGNSKYEVVFNDSEQSGYISYSKNKIVLSSALMRKINEYPIYDIVDIETGLALHESAHAEYTFNSKYLDAVQQYTELEHTINNILEDAIIEEIVSNDYPGYRQYFLKLRGYYFKQNSIKQTNNKLADRINEFLIGLRYPGDTIIRDKLAKEAIEVVNEVLLYDNEILKNVDRVDLTEEVYNILTRDIKKDENEKEDDDSNDDSDNEENSGDESNDNTNNDDSNSNESGKGNESKNKKQSKSSKLSKREKRKIDLTPSEIGGALGDFLNKEKENKEDKLSDKEKALINSILNENVEEDEYGIPSGSKFKTTTSIPIITETHVRKYNENKTLMNKYITKFRNKFADANTAYKETAYGLQSGILDEDSIYSAKYNRNIFMNNTITNMKRTKDIDIAFVIDNSGSMDSQLSWNDNIRRIDAAKQLCTLFVEALSPIKSVNTWVLGFQTTEAYMAEKSRNGGGGYNIYAEASYEERISMRNSTNLIKAYSPHHKTKAGISSLTANGLTPEYQALIRTKDILFKEGRKDSKKVIIMLTDGEPGDSRFSMGSQIKLIREEIKKCEKKNITLIHLALTVNADKTPYKNKISWNNKGFDSLIDSFIKTLKKEIK